MPHVCGYRNEGFARIGALQPPEAPHAWSGFIEVARFVDILKPSRPACHVLQYARRETILSFPR